MFLNEDEIEDSLRLTAQQELPNLRTGAVVLSRLKNWTNRNSDGWAYWHKPSAAAGKLQTLISQAQLYRGDATDITEAELKKALTPIKAFLTRQGVDDTTARRIFDEPQPQQSDEDLRQFIASTVDHCLNEAVVRFDGARRNQFRTPAQMRVLIATADIPQHLRTTLAAKYSETYE